ncbi:MAG: endonuclease III [Verrucomicrobiae bacterium]|nr:endonuclease III [Verrucomicrobiae bacterium]
MSESLAQKQARVRKLAAAFARAYPDAHCELVHSNPLELLVATILSAQCTDKRVNMVTPSLFRKYRSAKAFAAAPADELEQEIRSTGFYKSKTRSIQSACRTLEEKHAGKVPQTMEELIELGGVGRKTANVVLGNAFGKSEGIVVDTHVGRLSHRLGLSKASDPVKIEQDLIRLVPREQWTLWSHWLIFHGRRRCFARKPDCPGCEVRELCPSRDVARVNSEPKKKKATAARARAI